MNRNARLAKLEAAEPAGLSKRVRAWLGQRPPLAPEEAAADPVVDVDVSKLSAELRRWLEA